MSSIGAVDRKWGDNCRQILDNESNCYPSSDYGKSKLQSEQIIKDSKLRYTIIRPAMVIGEDMRMESHFSVFIRNSIKKLCLVE